MIINPLTGKEEQEIGTGLDGEDLTNVRSPTEQPLENTLPEQRIIDPFSGEIVSGKERISEMNPMDFSKPMTEPVEPVQEPQSKKPGLIASAFDIGVKTPVALIYGAASWPFAQGARFGAIYGQKAQQGLGIVPEMTDEEITQLGNDTAEWFSSLGGNLSPKTETGQSAMNIAGTVVKPIAAVAHWINSGIDKEKFPHAAQLAETTTEGMLFGFLHKFGSTAIEVGKKQIKARTTKKASDIKAAERVEAKAMKKLDDAISKNELNDSIEQYQTAIIEKARNEREGVVATERTDRSILQEGKEINTSIDKKVIPSSAEESFNKLKDTWIGDKDVKTFTSNVDTKNMQKELKKYFKIEKKEKRVLPYKEFELDEAMQIYIDAKRNPTHIKEFYNKLTTEQQKIVTLSQNLPAYAKTLADKIAKAYDKMGLEALDADVIRNVLDNYAGRLWKRDSKTGLQAKFSTTTNRAKQRKFDTIIEGWANGKELAVKSATENLNLAQKEIARTIADKNFVAEFRKLKDIDGNPLITTRPERGKDYRKLEHSNMSVWEPVAHLPKNRKAGVSGQNFFTTKEGSIFERRDLYAPTSIAKSLNNILGKSRLEDIPTVRELTKFNANAKAWVLQSSLYHHQAFLRSFYLPNMSLEAFKQTPRAAIKYGNKLIDQKAPVIIHGVRNGLTLGVKQDYSAKLLKEKTQTREFLSKQLKKSKITNKVRQKIGGFVDKINTLRDIQAEFLFNVMGSGLKANAYMIEFKKQVRKYPKEDVDVISKRVALLINDDFGGLHLGRLERNPTLQHLFKLAALAPDWTESNVRTLVKTLKNSSGSVAEKTMYRKFWAGAVIKGAALTAASNFILSGGDINEMVDKYKKAWETGNRNWMKTDVTSVYKMFGGKSKNTKYFNLSGHFLDPVKWVSKPGQSAMGKESILAGSVRDAITNSDWAGRQFTTFEELLDEGNTVKWSNNKKAINYEYLPSYILSQLISTQPIQLQNMIHMMQGELEPFEGILNSAGVHISTGRKKKGSGSGKLTSGLTNDLTSGLKNDLN